MEKLLARVEELVPAAGGPRAPLSPAELLAQQWRERLAANTMTGGQSGENDESRWRAAEQEVRNAQSQWARLGPCRRRSPGPSTNASSAPVGGSTTNERANPR